MILAEELDADWSKVALEAAPPNEKLYANPMLGVQATGNSNSIRAFWTPLRKAAAGSRALLVAAAAKQWGVDPASCTTANGVVIHKAIGRSLVLWRARGFAPTARRPPIRRSRRRRNSG